MVNIMKQQQNFKQKLYDAYETGTSIVIFAAQTLLITVCIILLITIFIMFVKLNWEAIGALGTIITGFFLAAITLNIHRYQTKQELTNQRIRLLTTINSTIFDVHSCIDTACINKNIKPQDLIDKYDTLLKTLSNNSSQISLLFRSEHITKQYNDIFIKFQKAKKVIIKLVSDKNTLLTSQIIAVLGNSKDYSLFPYDEINKMIADMEKYLY